MRVLQILSSTGFHGAESMAAELSRQLSGLGVDVDVAVLDNAGRGNDQIFSEVGGLASATYRIPCDTQFDFKTIFALAGQINRRQIDIVHSHCYKTTFYAGLLRKFKSRKQQFGLVSTYHNWLTHTAALKFYATVDKNLAKFNDCCVGVSRPVSIELSRYVDPNRVFQVDNGVDIEFYRPSLERDQARARLGFSSDQLLFGFVGRLSPEKGLLYLIKALASQELSNCNLIIAGDGPERTVIEAEIRNLGLGARVKLIGYSRDTKSVYAALDAFVLPSTVEAFPMVLLEAMACGVPVVATSVGEIPRMVESPVSGWVVSPANVGELRDVLISIKRMSRDALSEIGMHARARVIEKFSSREMANRYLDLYRLAKGGI